jgi:two-component system, chemotaxis family, chemotaxis protein CheY
MSLNILIVDDSLVVRAVVHKALKLAEVPINELHQAGDGREALTVLDNHRIDLIFSDLMMPVMDGEELITKLNENGMIKDIPVVVVSSAAGTERMIRLQRMGVKGFIHKPFTPEQISEVVDKVTGVRV